MIETTSPAVDVRCGACGAMYTEEQWRTLHIGQRVSSQEVRQLIRNWPTELVIEVRHCVHCGHLIPAKVQGRHTP